MIIVIAGLFTFYLLAQLLTTIVLIYQVSENLSEDYFWPALTIYGMMEDTLRPKIKLAGRIILYTLFTIACLPALLLYTVGVLVYSLVMLICYGFCKVFGKEQ